MDTVLQVLASVVRPTIGQLIAGVAIVALLAGLLGWLVGRAGRTHREEPLPPPTVETVEPEPYAADVPASAITAADVPEPTGAEGEPPTEGRSELDRALEEIGRLEAAALTAWDRTVPYLEEHIADMSEENDALRRDLKRAQERLEVEARSAQDLREALRERDQRHAQKNPS